jgi:hypothetical protein
VTTVEENCHVILVAGIISVQRHVEVFRRSSRSVAII